jgi:hypothetical protein
MWLKTMLAELGMPLKAIPIYGDSQGTIFNASNSVQEKRMKHIDIQYHYIRESVQDGKVKLYYHLVTCYYNFYLRFYLTFTFSLSPFFLT